MPFGITLVRNWKQTPCPVSEIRTLARAQPCSSTQGSNLQSAVHWAYLLEANFNQAAFCDFLMDFVNHTLFIVLRWLSQPGSLRKSQDQMVEQRPIKYR